MLNQTPKREGPIGMRVSEIPGSLDSGTGYHTWGMEVNRFGWSDIPIRNILATRHKEYNLSVLVTLWLNYHK